MLKKIQQKRNWENQVVLLRLDLNVPIKRKKILDDRRIQDALPTIAYLQGKGAKIVIITHVGRPEGRVKASLTVEPIAKRLAELLKAKVQMLETKNWKLSDKKKQEIIADIEGMKAGDVAIMENIRFSPKEEQNDSGFAQELAVLGDIFVFDAFGAAHRDAASVNGIANYLPSYAGLLIQKELTALETINTSGRSPFIAILGGAKMKTKIPLIKKISTQADRVLIGGCILTTYLWARKYKVGDSLVEKSYKKEILAACTARKVMIPADVIVGDMQGKHYRVVDIKPYIAHQICKKGEAILDIGPKTIARYARLIKSADMLLWNGAMGYYEQEPYHIGTASIARLVATIAHGPAYGVIGGGETVDALQKSGMYEYVDHVSSGGGAMLAYLAGDKLPGIEAVCK